MADAKLTALTALAGVALNDLLYLVDVSDTTDDAAGSSREITVQNVMLAAAQPNLILNSDFSIDQRGKQPYTSTTNPPNSDGNYTIDQWVLLEEANDSASVNVAVGGVSVSGGPVVGNNTVQLLVAGTTNNKFGFLQILENKVAFPLAGLVVSLQFKAKLIAAISGVIRIGVLYWTGTADAPTRDVVSVWGAVGTNPTLVTSWTFANTPANVQLTGSFATYKLENVSIPSTATNVAIFIWNEDKTTVAGDGIALADVKLEQSAICTPYQPPVYADQLARCQRFFFSLGGSTNSRWFLAGAISTTQSQFSYPLPVTMRIAPTLTLVGTGLRMNDNGVDIAVTSLGTQFTDTGAIGVLLTSTTATLTSNRNVVVYPNDTSSFLRASCEL